MSVRDSDISMGLDRLNALFAWWGVPNSSDAGGIEAQMKRFEVFTSALQKTCGEAYSQQMQALFTANERLVDSLQALMRCRQPQDFIAAESNILASFLEGASLQARTWLELTQKVQDCCAAMAHECGGQLAATAPSTPPAEMRRHAVRPAGKQTTKHPEHA